MRFQRGKFTLRRMRLTESMWNKIEGSLIPASALLRLAAWACVALLAVLSLLPADEIVRTSFGGHVEHATAYAGATALFRMGYPRQQIVRQIVALVAYAAALEFAQNFSPGRTPAVGDWLFSSIGVVIGSVIGLGLSRATQRWTHKCPVP